MEVVDLIMIFCIIGSVLDAWVWVGDFMTKVVLKDKRVNIYIIIAILILAVAGALLSWLGVILYIVMDSYNKGIDKN